MKLTNNQKFKKNLKKFAHEYGAGAFDISKEDINEMLEDIQFRFDPIDEWDFEPIFTYKAKGDYFLSNNYRHNKMFGQNGLLLYEVTGDFTTECFASASFEEVWLLENMELVIVNNFHIKIDGNGGDYISEYRYCTKEFCDFEIEDFLENVQRKVDETHYKH